MRPSSPQFSEWLAAPIDQKGPVARPTIAGLPVLVVGAGPAGLAAMAALKRAGIAFEGVEAHSGVGGIWDETNPVSSMYEGMRTATTRATTYLSTPMPRDWPHFVPFELAVRYLREFAASEGLTPRISFRTRFLDALKTKAGTWEASLQSPDRVEPTRREFRAIVIATGSHNRDHAIVDEKTRTEAETNGIKVIHSAQYRRPSLYAGKRVLVVGAGASATDIAAKLSAAASRTILSIRTSPWILPASLLKWTPLVMKLGIVPDSLAADSSRTPGRPRLAIAELAVRLTGGDLRRFGLPRPQQRLHDRIPTLDRGILAAIRAGRVVIKPVVSGFRPGTVRFDDGTEEQIDELILATGFARSYPLLMTNARNATLASIPQFYLFHPDEPGLAFMTECVGQGSAWPIFVEQARTIAAYFAAEQRGARNAAIFNARRRQPTPNFKGKLFAGADVFHLDYKLYTRALRDLAAWLGE